MKLRAIKRYVDRYTKEIVEKGSLVEEDEERAGELMEEGAAVPEKGADKAVLKKA